VCLADQRAGDRRPGTGADLDVGQGGVDQADVARSQRGADVRAQGFVEPLASGDGPLIYLSLGSLGSADIPLMERLVDSLAKTPHRYVVSKGPQHDAYELAPNMVGEEFLPQVSVLPHVDLVITHGGNNTVTECMHHGKPMVLLPIFWDQHDNAQRIDETGFGIRLPTYSFGDGDLPAAIDRLLADDALGARLADVSKRLQAAPGSERAAELIEQVAAGS
jgi:MGT family glycosyltransferase